MTVVVVKLVQRREWPGHLSKGVCALGWLAGAAEGGFSWLTDVGKPNLKVDFEVPWRGAVDCGEVINLPKITSQCN